VELDQNIFSYFFKFTKKRQENLLNKKKELLNSVELKDLKDSLVIFASAVFDLPIEIRETPDFPYKSGNKLFLPPFLAVASSHCDNHVSYQLLVLHLFAIFKSTKPLPKPMSLLDELKSIDLLIPNAQKLLVGLYPNYETKYELLTKDWSEREKRRIAVTEEKPEKIEQAGFNPLAIWGRLPRMPNIIHGSNAEPEMREALPDVMTERKSKSRGEVKKVDFEENKDNIGQDVFHHFEKVETAEEYKGIQRDTDGADELASHADALDDLNLEEVIRTSKAAKSLYKTELDMGFEIADLKEEKETNPLEQAYFYDEWDEKNRTYKNSWCRILHSLGEVGQESPIKGKSHADCLISRHIEISKLKKKMIQLASEVRVEKKLILGREIDIDNVIRNACIRKTGNSGDQRYYKEAKKRHRDMACVLLVDTSLSSDSWVQNKRVLDVCLEALLLFGEASKDLGDPIMVAGFNSNTRHDCKFIEWKSFDQPWGKFVGQVDHIHPAGYTRIGPAIRHATKLLADRKERHKLLMIFTDGRPTDFDRYEGNYGLSDVRQAIRESDQKGVVSFALAVDPSAKQFLPKLFGLGNFQILVNMKNLPEMLAKLYAKMAKRR